MRVLITGVAGFIGRRLAGYLRDQGHQVAGTYIETRPDLEGIERYEVNLLAEDRFRETVQQAAPQAVIHLAGLSHVGSSWSRPADYFQVNVLGTEGLLRCTTGVRFLAASSAEVYGAVPEDQQPILETRRVAPESPYALTKAAMERQVIAAGGVVVRAFNIIGPGQALNFALPTFARQLAAMRVDQRDSVLEVGNLTARRDFVHLDDSIRAYEVFLHQSEPGECYNLGSGTAYSIQEVLDRLITISGLAPEVREDPSRVRPVDLPLLQADNHRLSQLGWQQSRDLDQALQDLWDATLSQATGEPGTDGASSA